MTQEVDAVGATTLTVGAGFTEAVAPGDHIKVYGTAQGKAPPRGSRLVTVIESRQLIRGTRSDINPERLVTEYWSLEGVLLAEADKFAGDALTKLEDEVEYFQGRCRGLEEDSVTQHEEIRRLTTALSETEERAHEIAALKKQVSALNAELAAATCPDGMKPPSMRKGARRGRAKR